MHLFFFFFEFRPDWAVSADTGRYGRYGPSRPDFGRVGADFRRIGADFSRVGPIRDLPRGTTRSDAARTRGLRRPCRVPVSRRVGRGCAGLGAASVHPRWEGKMKIEFIVWIDFLAICNSLGYTSGLFKETLGQYSLWILLLLLLFLLPAIYPWRLNNGRGERDRERNVERERVK